MFLHHVNIKLVIMKKFCWWIIRLQSEGKEKEERQEEEQERREVRCEIIKKGMLK